MPLTSDNTAPLMGRPVEEATANPGESRDLGTDIVFKVVIRSTDKRDGTPKRIEDIVKQELEHKFGDNVTVARA